MPDDIVIRFSVKDDGTPTIERVNKKLGETKKESEALAPGIEKARRSFTGFISENAGLIAVLTGTAVALKKVYDTAKEGAELEFTQVRFERLAESVDTTADALLDRMTVATKGTLSQFEAMQAATDLLSLGLAKDADEAVRLATVQSGLAMDTNQLVLTLSNQTTMRFDALGVGVDGFKEKVEALEAAGMSANDAFKEAFLQQAEEQLLRVGDAADSNLGSFKRLEAQIKNQTDAMKVNLSSGLAPYIDKLVEANDKIMRQEEALKAANPELYKQYQALHILTPEMKAVIEQYNQSEEALARSGDAFADWSEKVDHSNDSIFKTIELTEEMSAANAAWLDLIGEISGETQDYNDTLADLQDRYAEEVEKLNELTTSRWWDTEAIDEQQTKIAELGEKMTEETANFEENTRRRILSMLEEQLAADGLSEAETQYLEDLGLQWGLYSDDAIQAARDARAEVQALVDQFNNLPTERTMTINLQTIESIMARGGVGHAEGTQGWLTVPPGFSNDSYPVFLTSGEKYAVMTQAESQSNTSPYTGGGGGGNPAMLIPALQKFADEIARSNRAAFEKAGRR